MIKRLNNQILLDSYVKAKELELDFYFIFLLEEEIQRRNILGMPT